MSSTTHARARRAGSLVAALGVMMGMFLVASPAQAAVSVDLTVNDTTITEGESVTLTWTSGEAIDLVASGSWSGNKANPAGNEVVTPAAAGDFTYTLMATDENGRESTDSVTVTVAPGPITPNPVTFPDDCTVVIPSTPHVTYFVDYGDGDTEELDADTYEGLEFSDGETVTFYAEADQGFTLAAGATTEWDYAAPESCFDIDEGPDLVTTKVTCGSVTFTNTTDGPLDILYGSFDEEQPDGEFTLAAGASRTIKTKHSIFAFIALADQEDEEAPVQIRILDVPQDCGDVSDGGDDSGSGSDHPTVAPAAGIAAR